jgi:hypothetical protein
MFAVDLWRGFCISKFDHTAPAKVKFAHFAVHLSSSSTFRQLFSGDPSANECIPRGTISGWLQRCAIRALVLPGPFTDDHDIRSDSQHLAKRCIDSFPLLYHPYVSLTLSAVSITKY